MSKATFNTTQVQSIDKHPNYSYHGLDDQLMSHYIRHTRAKKDSSVFTLQSVQLAVPEPSLAVPLGPCIVSRQACILYNRPQYPVLATDIYSPPALGSLETT